MLEGLSKFIYSKARVILLAGLLFLVIGGGLATGVYSSLKDGGFFSNEAESTRAAQTLQQQLGQNTEALLVLYSSKDGLEVSSPFYREAVETSLARIKTNPNVSSITTYYDSSSARLISKDRLSTYAVIGLTGDDDSRFKTVKRLRPLLTSDRLQLYLGGDIALTQEKSDQAEKDLQLAEAISIPLVGILLAFVFKSLLAALLPLAIGIFSVLGSYTLLRIFGSFSDVSVFAVNITNLVALGLGIDYSLFVVSRFREELVINNRDVAPALTRTLKTAGRTILFSGLIVAISFLSLLVFPQTFFKGMGLGGAASVSVAVAAALTILPALLVVLGNRVNRFNPLNFKPIKARAASLRREAQGNRQGLTSSRPAPCFWYRAVYFGLRHPLPVILLTLVFLLLGASPLLRANLEVGTPATTPEGFQSRIVAEKLQADFPKNETVPILIVLKAPGPVLAADNLRDLYDYIQKVSTLKNVARVDSLVSLDPQLTKEAYPAFYSQAGQQQNPAAARSASFFARDNFTFVSVLYQDEPTAPTTKELVRAIRALPGPRGWTTGLTGLTAVQIDMLNDLATYTPIAVSLIVVVIFVLLFLMLGSLVVPLKAVLLNCLTLSFGFGLLVLVFQDGYLSNLLGFKAGGTLDPLMLVLIFAIAFGLSMDYEVFLLSRIKEQYDLGKDNYLAITTGVQKTGQIITNAAILLVIVVGAFAVGVTLNMKQIGVGLALIILVDATLVRMLLVPATMRLLGRYNWWAPRLLLKIYQRAGLSECEPQNFPLQEVQAKVATKL